MFNIYHQLIKILKNFTDSCDFTFKYYLIKAYNFNIEPSIKSQFLIDIYLHQEKKHI